MALDVLYIYICEMVLDVMYGLTQAHCTRSQSILSVVLRWIVMAECFQYSQVLDEFQHMKPVLKKSCYNWPYFRLGAFVCNSSHVVCAIDMNDQSNVFLIKGVLFLSHTGFGWGKNPIVYGVINALMCQSYFTGILCWQLSLLLPHREREVSQFVLWQSECLGVWC